MHDTIEAALERGVKLDELIFDDALRSITSAAR